MALKNRVGPPVTGDDFYGRTNELAQANDFLESYHSLALSAPRRIGKSSFAKRLIDDKKAAGWSCAYIDLEGIRNKDEFLRILINQFDKSNIWSEAARTAGSLFSTLIEGVKGIGPVKLDLSLAHASDDLYTTLSTALDHTKDTLIVIDELTLFLGIIDREDEKHREAAFLLNWLRSLRQTTDSKIRWIFCGSVGLHNFTRMRNLSMTINDLVSFNFDAMSNDEARGLARALFESENLQADSSTIEYFLNKIEWHIPYFIQLLFTNLKNHPETKNGISNRIIDTVFDKLAHSEEFSTWSERLSEYNGQEESARLLLNEISKSSQGLSKDQLLAILIQQTGLSQFNANQELSLILNMLEHDGYLIRSDGNRRFRSPLLKKWWHYKFVE